MIKAIQSLFLICILTLTGSMVFAEETEDTALKNLHMLESLAKRNLDNGNARHALELYKQYERIAAENGYSYLQKDLLVNQAIAAYRSEKYGEATAYVKQLMILEATPERANILHTLRSIIEHGYYQKNPNIMFVRGDSSEYTQWETFHKYSESEIQLVLYLVWSTLFIMLSIIYVTWQRKKHKFLLPASLICAAGLIIFLTTFSYQRYKTNSMQFGVLINADMLRQEPGESSQECQDEGFVPGITVMVVTQIPGWLLIRRADNVTAWIPTNDFYLLRGKGEQKSSLINVQLKPAAKKDSQIEAI